MCVCVLMMVGKRGVRVCAVPIFRVTWTARVVNVVGAGLRRAVQRNGPVDVTAHRVLWEADRTRESLEDAFRVVPCGRRRELYLHPHQRCAVCGARIVSTDRIYMAATAAVGATAQAQNVEWMPQLLVCHACPARSFTLWRTFRFTMRAPHGAEAAEAAGASDGAEEATTLVTEGAHESVWRAGARVVETLAVALASGAAPRSAFARALSAALCDLKLLRIVAERMLPPEPRPSACARVLSVLVETRQH